MGDGWVGGLNTGQERDSSPREGESSKNQQCPLQAWPRLPCHPNHGKENSLSPHSACLLSHVAQPNNPAPPPPERIPYEVPSQVLIEIVCLFFKQE